MGLALRSLLVALALVLAGCVCPQPQACLICPPAQPAPSQGIPQ